jgi:hypothetical protein
MHVHCANFFFSLKFYTDLQLSLFYLKVVALRRSVVGCHSYRPLPERQCTSPRSLLSCEFLSCHRGAFDVYFQNLGVASRHCFIFIFTYISALEDETTTMLRNVWYPSPSDAAAHPRKETFRCRNEPQTEKFSSHCGVRFNSLSSRSILLEVSAISYFIAFRSII